MLKMLFLFSLAITVALTALQFTGTQVLDLIIMMIIIDFISLGAYLEIENRKINKETRSLMTSKFESIENLCRDIITHIISPNPGFEAKLEKQKDDMNYILDKIAKKSLELEEKLNVFGRALTENLDAKVKVDERTEEEKETEAEKDKEEEIEEEKGEAQSFSVGEIVYVNEEDKD